MVKLPSRESTTRRPIRRPASNIAILMAELLTLPALPTFRYPAGSVAIRADGQQEDAGAEALASESTTRYHETSRRLMPSIESNQLLLAAAAACEDKKAEDIRILALDPAESGLTDYFLICNGTNERQNVAITDEVELRLKREFGVYPNSVEGRRQGEWILMDYVDFIVHVFSAEKRAYYGLERLRKSATTISVADLATELKAFITSARAKAPKPPAIRKVGAKKAMVKKASLRKSSSTKVKKK